jgi:hypothetical protein
VISQCSDCNNAYVRHVNANSEGVDKVSKAVVTARELCAKLALDTADVSCHI